MALPARPRLCTILLTNLLFEEETKSTNEGYEKGQVSELGAVNVMTGIYTGRSPKDKYHRHGRELQGHRVVDERRATRTTTIR